MYNKLTDCCLALTAVVCCLPQSLSRDLLHTVIEFRSPPGLNSATSRVVTLRNLSAALSACIHQSLCDSDSFVVALTDHVDIGMEGFTR